MIRDEIFDVIFVIRRVDYLIPAVESVCYPEKIFHPIPKKKPYICNDEKFGKIKYLTFSLNLQKIVVLVQFRSRD